MMTNSRLYFPAWKYHATEPAVVVNNEAELDALGDGWADTPAAFETVAEPEPKKTKKK